MKICLVITEELCSGCGNCVVACPINSLNSHAVKGGKGGESKVFQCRNGRLLINDAQPCNGCGVCLESCPTNALSIVSFDNQNMEPGWRLLVQPPAIDAKWLRK